jgi:hypothetical protein
MGSGVASARRLLPRSRCSSCTPVRETLGGLKHVKSSNLGSARMNVNLGPCKVHNFQGETSSFEIVLSCGKDHYQCSETSIRVTETSSTS